MKIKSISFFLLVVAFSGFTYGAHLSHKMWNDLLQKYVSVDGKVNYKGFKQNKAALDVYLQHLSQNTPQVGWSDAERMAYWINAYNAFTIDLIVKNYPVKSIMDLYGGKAWDQKFIKMGDKTYSLNDIEHEILRKKFNEPRIHFAIVCASFSCPKLLNKAFTAENLEELLTSNTKAFVNDRFKNKIASNAIVISQLFNWFAGDFTKSGTIIDFLNKYSVVKINANAKVGYLEYNWSLNE